MDVHAEILLRDDEMADDLCVRLAKGIYAPAELARRFVCRVSTDRVLVRCEISEWPHTLSKLEGDGFRVICSSSSEEELENLPFEVLVSMSRADAAEKSIDSYFVDVSVSKAEEEKQ